MNPPPPAPLPIDPYVPGIVRALEEGNACVVCAEPGAGKTTRVPPALLPAAFSQDREIWVLQPRRIAAKLAAVRVAQEMGEEPGRTVGYHFRFERSFGASTRLKYLTDGMLLPLAHQDPEFRRVAAVVLDEFHERSLALDLALGYLRRLQKGPRPDLRLLVMSATLDADAVSAFLSGCPVFKSEGRVFPVAVEYLHLPEEPDLSQRVRTAVRAFDEVGLEGTTLAFLPGVGEIKRAAEALRDLPAEVCMLYGDLPVSEQQRVLAPSSGRKIILTTNVAETSLTVPGVTAVVDSCLTRQARVSPWSGLTRLVTVSASQASSAQRAGRAGRVQKGACIRLCSKFDFDRRPAYDAPEVLRSDLSEAVLDLACLGVDDADAFPWFTRPADGALEAARLLLRRLGALDDRGRPTGEGRRMARFPLSPRLARFLLAVQGSGRTDPAALRLACRLSALLSEESADSEDLLEELDRFRPGYTAQKLEEHLAEEMGVAAHAVKRKATLSEREALARGLLAAFPDRVARVKEGVPARDKTGMMRELLLCSGGSALAPDGPLLRANEFFVMAEAQETGSSFPGRGETGARTKMRARSLCPVSADWLLDLFPDDLAEEEECAWNDKSKRVEGWRRLRYGQMVVDEKPMSAKDMEPKASELLFKEALSAGPSSYCDPEELAAFLNRARFTAQVTGEFQVPTDEEIQKTLAELCRGCRSLKELKAAELVVDLRARLKPKAQALLERLAPLRVTLKSGRDLPVHYEADRPPWVESRLQDFFGMTKGPAVAGGAVPLVLHLLAPNRRPVQVTTDLAGFWTNHYPQVRHEMMRKYPRHKWPEKPL